MSQLSDFVEVEQACANLERDIYDARFTRSVLLIVGAMLVACGVYLMSTPGLIAGGVSWVICMGIQAWALPKLDAQTEAVRAQRARLVWERLGQGKEATVR